MICQYRSYVAHRAARGVCAAALVALAGALVASAERVTLRGGAIVDAPLLKDDGETLVLDLGHTALTVPRAHVLEVETEPADAAAAVAASSAYTVGRLPRLSTTEAARRFAPSVVVVRSPGGLGSGFFVNATGDLITNFHVIRGHKRITVTRFVEEGRALTRRLYENVRIIATDPFHDLAVLRIEPGAAEGALPHVVLAPDQPSRLGESIFVIGNPLGLERSVTQGVVSQAARNFAGKLYLQIDAPVNPGNSGGPLFDGRGQVIGVINMGVPVMQGLNFAIPIRHVMFLLDHLDAYAYDEANPESGFVYPDPPRRPVTGRTPALSESEDEGDPQP